MTLRLVVRSLASRPVRSAVLSCGFGFGIGVMAALLGVGQVILEQARAVAVEGAGDVAIGGAAGAIGDARFLISGVLSLPPLAGRAAAASPSAETALTLVHRGQTTRVRARGGIPSLERSLGDPETSGIAAWADTPADGRWSSPDPGDVLRAMDRFHPIPDTPWRARSWAEWLYFNGRSRDGSARFYLTFLAGPRSGLGRRAAGVRLQLERAGRVSSYSTVAEVFEASLLESAPDIEIGANRVRLEGLRYRINLALDAEPKRTRAAAHDLMGEITLQAVAGRSIPPFAIRGARGWVSGYVIPVLAGSGEGTLRAEGETIAFEDATGYHDHNWGFWEGVTWQWGQVAHDDLSFVYGRVHPPTDAADPERLPGFLAVLGPSGPLGFSTNVLIEETDTSPLGPSAGPRSIRVRARGAEVQLDMDLTVESAIPTPMMGPFRSGSGAAMNFFQLRALYRVTGRVADRPIAFTTSGSAETFR